MASITLPESPKRLDSLALDGLRGIASLHVMVRFPCRIDRYKELISFYNLFTFQQVFHYLLVSGKAYICGSLEMSLFYLLSGFGLALSYGRTVWDGWTFLGGRTEGDRVSFGALKFYRNRFAR